LLADRRWDADKFELKVAAHAAFCLCSSLKSLLLSSSPEKKAFSDVAMGLGKV